MAFLCGAATTFATTKILFLPFDDRVKLKDTWVLGVDVPRYFSTMVDTIGSYGKYDSSLAIVPFDSVLNCIKSNSWSRVEYTSPLYIVKLAHRFKADYVINGTVAVFKVVKRAVNTTAPLYGGADLSSVVKNTTGGGGITVMGGLQSYTATAVMGLDLLDGSTGQALFQIPLNTSEKDGGFKIYATFQSNNPEMDYYEMSTTPFGSPSFQRSVPGIVMKTFSQDIQNKVCLYKPVEKQPKQTDRSYSVGSVLERSGSDVYINFGSADNVMQGEEIEVQRPDHAIIVAGDTLGWSDKTVGVIRVRFIKSPHLSQASIVSEVDSIRSGDAIRFVMVPSSR